MKKKTLLSVGDIVADKYQVRAVLGAGGMGAVYLVRHALTGKRLALKMLHASSRGTSEAEKRLIREAVAVGQIEHRNVVNVFDLGEHEGHVFLVMEYLEGKALQRLFTEKALSDAELIELMLRAMDGVRAAHAQGVVHRDLKPDNILVCQGPSGRYDDPRILDFGVCRLTMHAEHTQLTKVGLTLGSPYYMSLEQFEGVRDIDARADVYSLGVILYQGLGGRRPFEARSLPELTSRIASGKPPRHLAELRPDLPRALCDAVMWAMARRREDRPNGVVPLMQELVVHLPALGYAPGALPVGQAGAGGHAHVLAPLRGALPAAVSSRPPARRRSRNREAHMLQLALIGCISFLLALAGVYVGRRVFGPEPELSAQPAMGAPPAAQPPSSPVITVHQQPPEPAAAPEPPAAPAPPPVAALEPALQEARDQQVAEPGLPSAAPMPIDQARVEPQNLDARVASPRARRLRAVAPRPVQASPNPQVLPGEWMPNKAGAPSVPEVPAVLDLNDPYR